MVNLLKFINTTNLKKMLVLIVLLGIYVFLSAYSYVNAVSENLESNLFRLHIIANSDNKEDQDLKYLVRNDLISYMNSISKHCKTKQEVINIAKHHVEDFYNIAKSTIQKNGFDYDVDILIGNFDFPTKVYGDITLPAGYYDALRVKIGEAKGQNWWCVMFPPLCFIDVSSGIVPESSKETLRAELSEENYMLISENNSDIKFKFKIVEFFHKNNLFTAKKHD